jgi:CSLREA domain-containing protein
MIRRRPLVLALAALGLALPAAAGAATIPVTTTADTTAADGLCSLREAVFAARFDMPVQGCPAGEPAPVQDVVQLEATTYALAAGGADEDGNAAGDLDTGPTSSLRVVGRGMGATVIAAAGNRAFDVFAGATLGLSDLTIRDAVSAPSANGGAIRSRGTLTVLRVAFLNAAAGAGTPRQSIDGDPSQPGGGGGAIWSEGQLQVADSLFSGTRAGDGAVGTHFEEPSPGGGTRSVDTGPSAGGDGGAILVTGGAATITGSTFTGARAGDGRDKPSDVEFAPGGDGGSGGAIAVLGGSASIVNATFAGDRAGNAGAPHVGFLDSRADPGSGGAVAAVAPGTASVSFSTFSGNAVGTGASGAVGAGASVSGASVGASIMADAGGACATLGAALPNVVLPGDTSCPGTRIAGDPRLGPLADNGGPVPTMLPGAGSKAIDAIVGVPCPATDARGLIRPRFAGCDAGAVELQPGAPGAPGGTGGGGGGVVTGTRSIGAVALTKTAFRTRGRNPGTTVTYRLGLAGRVVLSVQKPVAGKRSGRRCVAPTRRLKHAKRCVRRVTLRGSIVRRGHAGTNTLRFTGILARHRLAPGPYTMVLTLPRTAAARAVSVSRGFRILR